MFISDLAIRKPVLTIVTMLALVVFGGVALFTLDTDEFPDVQPPVVVVSVPYPGASPDVVERELVDPIEEAIGGISGVDKMQSQAMDGFASILVFFDFSIDPAQAQQDVRDRIGQIRNRLPVEMEEPVLTRWNPNDQPIVSLALAAEGLAPEALTRLADPGITRELRGLNGVAEVTVRGGVDREMTVEVRPEAMQAAGVGVPQIVAALQTQNLAVPVGRISGALDERSIRLRGRLETPEDFANVVVAQRDGRVIRLREVADVRDGAQEARSLALFNGTPAVGIDVYKSQGYSTTAVADGVLGTVEGIRARLPAGVELTVVRNTGERVTASVRSVQRTLLEGAILTVLVVFLFLNSWRSTIITGLALPVSVLASFIAVSAFGFTLNTMSLLGLSLAIGILIDDAIVVRENIVRHVEMGKDHYTAAREGTAEIGLAVAAITFSIVCVFVPIAFMGGIAQQWFAPFALTIACSVLVSLFVSFSLDPMLSAYWPDPHREEHEKAWITRRLDRFNAWFDRRASGYKRLLRWAVDHRLAMVLLALGTFVGALAVPVKGASGFAAVMGVTLAAVFVLTTFRAAKAHGWGGRTVRLATALAWVALLFGGLSAVPAWAKLGGEFFPQDDRSEFYVKVETPPGSSLEYTRIKAEEVAAVARGREEVAYTYVTVGGLGGVVDEAMVYVRLVPKHTRAASQTAMANWLRGETDRIGGASLALVTNLFNDQKQIQLELRGPDIGVLNELAARIETEVRQVPGAVDVGLSTKGQKPELEVRLDRGLAGSLGISAAQVAQALRPAFAGLDVGDWVDPSGETRDVMVRLAPEARSRTADLEMLPLVLPGPQGPVTLPLGQVAAVERGLGPAVITHLNRERAITVQANTQNRPLSEVIGDIETRLRSVPLPAGYRLTQGGETEDQNEVFGRILLALGVAVLLMYLILVVQFGSFLDPFAIMLSLPLSLVGVVLGLLVTGNTLNIMSMIGVILLAGIVAKNAILLIDFAKWAKEKGMSRRDAIVEAGGIRLRPILMTSFALTAGMVPVALGTGEGAQFRAPMGIAVIGGLVTSTLLTLLVIPTIWVILDEAREAVFGFFRRGAEPVATGGKVPVPALQGTPVLESVE
jgi:hydrophobic/amphiphilic exporter-1 (mainly G- bacteria), HAE1 family